MKFVSVKSADGFKGPRGLRRNEWGFSQGNGIWDFLASMKYELTIFVPHPDSKDFTSNSSIRQRQKTRSAHFWFFAFRVGSEEDKQHPHHWTTTFALLHRDARRAFPSPITRSCSGFLRHDSCFSEQMCVVILSFYWLGLIGET